MSLYFAPAGITEERLASVARELVGARDVSQSKSGPGGFLWAGRQPERFGPAYDEASGVRVLSSGHLSFSAMEWAEAARLPYQGGLACRLILRRYFTGGVDAVAPFNGSTVLVIHDPRDGQSHIWTDQLGYHPCFAYRLDDASKLIVTTFPDALLADPAADLHWDMASMTEFFRAWRVTPPHTYFKEARHVGAATHLRVDPAAGAVARTAYWRPFETEFFPSIDAAAEALADAVRTGVQERTAVSEKTVFWVSGGADSRVLLFSVDDPERVAGAHIHEHDTEEVEVARRLCEKAGSRFLPLRRDNDYYPRTMQGAVRWSGAMWSTDDSHYFGFEEDINALEPDLVMSACTTDWVFKGYGLEKEHISLFGKNLPFLRYQDERVDAFLPNMPLPAPTALQPEIEARMLAWFDGTPRRLQSARDRLLVEDRRIRPACYTVSVSGQFMYRIYPYDTFLADSRIADCYSATHPDWKLNREVWGKAAARLCVGAGDVVDSNYGWRVDASMSQKAFVFAKGWLTRRLRKLSRAGASQAPDDRPPAAGSWPDYGWYATHSETLRGLWASITPEERERMALITGADFWREPIDVWRHDGAGLFRLMTLLSHWRETDRRRRTANLPSIV